MNLHDLINLPLQLDEDGVWVRPDAKPFGYTDGQASEQYLEQVFSEAKDLSSRSAELAAKIKDWPSEYHLTPKRSQLLRGFNYDRAAKVLEVGCGCGAITRFLGETFDDVVSVEGSHARARLARMRTRDLEQVTIINSPFEELKFKRSFDLIFCVGVFEYASMFVAGDDPHRRILDYFSELLAPGGTLVLAIENQLGLKYFSSSAEDHTGVMFDGIEGYPRFAKKAKTFGRVELEQRLRENFPATAFHYPWPDYKIPSCLLTEEMLSTVDCAELVGSFHSTDYGVRGRKPLFDEALAWRQLAKNELIPSLAHSFLVIATKGESVGLKLDTLGRLYSSGRRPEFSTVTRFEPSATAAVDAVKRRRDGTEEFGEGKLHHRASRSPWVAAPSVQMLVAERSRAQDLSLDKILEPAKSWHQALVAASDDGQLPGEMLDSIWRNAMLDEEGQLHWIDQEWFWAEPLALDLLVARGLYYFAQSLIGAPQLGPTLSGMRVERLILDGAATLGSPLDAASLARLVTFEAALLDQIVGKGRLRSRESDVRAVLQRNLEQSKKIGPASLPQRGVRWLRRRLR